jgi:glutamate-1-semialdehyde 2,1-aminomutase
LLPGLEPLGVPRELQGTARGFSYNDLDALDAALNKLEGNLAVVVMEPMRSVLPQDHFLEEVKKRCHDAGAILVFDEVTSGWRFGFPGAHSTLGVEPDIAVYAKAMSNGYACGAIVGRTQIMDAANASFISSTYWTEGVGPAAAIASLSKMKKQQVQKRVWEKGEKFKARLEQLVASHPLSKLKIAGMPPSLTLTFDLGEQSALARVLLIRKMMARGFLVSGLFYLMHAHTDEQIESVTQAMDEVLGEIDACIERETLAQEVGEVKVHEGFRRLV